MSESTDQKDDALSRAEGRDLSHEKVLVVVKKQQEVIDQLKSQNTELQAEKKKMIVLLKRLDEKNKAELEKFREKENQANDDLQAMMVAIEKTQNQKIELMEKLEVSERELRVCKEKLEMKSLESAELSKNYDEIAEKFSSQGERIVTLETELSLSQAKNIELLSDIDGRESKTPKISLDCEEIEKLRNELSKTRSEKAASDAEVQNLNTLFEQLKISLGNPKSVDLLNAVEHLKSRAINAESFEKKVLSLEKEKSSVQTEFKELHESTARLQSRVDELSLSKSTVNNVDENIVQKLTLQVEELKSQVELQSKTILELEDKENRISNILSLAEIEKTSLRVSKDNLELALVDYHLKLSISEKETSVLKQAFISLSDELSEFRLSLQNELDELSKKNYDSRNSHSEGENSFISYQEKVSKLEDELKSCIKLSNDRLHQLNQHECELKLLKKKNENLLTESENIKVTELEISKLKSENSDLSAIIGSLQTEVQQLRTNTEVIKGQLEEFETEKLHLLEKISSLEFTISEDLKKFNELSLVKKIQDEKNTSEILHYKLTVDKLQVEQSEKTKEISQLLMELSTLKDQIAVVQSSISEKDLIIKNLMTLESDYKSSLNDLESSSKRESALIKEIESLKADLKQSQEKNNSMHHESGPPMMKRLENENSDLRNNLKLAEEKAVESVSLNNKLSLELAEYESSLSHIKAENESYKQKLTSMESLNNEVDSYKQEIIELRKTNEALLNDISTLHETVKQSSMRKEGDMSHREKLQMLQKKYESTLLELENERTHVAEATALLVDEKGNVASLKSKLEDYVARVDEDQSRIQALNKSLSNMKQSLEQAQKEKAELIAQKEILLKEGKKLKALLLRTNKHLEEMKKTMAQDQTHISALKAAECSLDSIRTEMQSHWLIDPTRVSEEVISSIDSYSVLHRIYLQGKWWYLVKFEYSESSKNTNTLPSNIDSSCQDSTTLSNNYESIIFWTSANVFKQKLGIGNSIEDSDSNSSEVVLAGKLKIPIPVHTAMERSLKEKFDKNWKTAAAKYEDLVKDLVI